MSNSNELSDDSPISEAEQREKAATSLLDKLDARQDQVISDLDGLNDQIEDLIDSWRQGSTVDEVQTDEDHVESDTDEQAEAA
jgi:ppGpp synthetase/RelA/SpoT-type nucleotidyltranferase